MSNRTGRGDGNIDNLARTDMDPSNDQTNAGPARQDAEVLLRRIGWHSSNWTQIEVYAHMSPARKVSQMLGWRHQQMLLLKSRLRQEHQGCTDIELGRMVQEHLDLLRGIRY
jgi:hypothetical protein